MSADNLLLSIHTSFSKSKMYIEYFCSISNYFAYVQQGVLEATSYICTWHYVKEVIKMQKKIF